MVIQTNAFLYFFANDNVMQIFVPAILPKMTTLKDTVYCEGLIELQYQNQFNFISIQRGVCGGTDSCARTIFSRGVLARVLTYVCGACRARPESNATRSHKWTPCRARPESNVTQHTATTANKAVDRWKGGEAKE